MTTPTARSSGCSWACTPCMSPPTWSTAACCWRWRSSDRTRITGSSITARTRSTGISLSRGGFPSTSRSTSCRDGCRHAPRPTRLLGADRTRAAVVRGARGPHCGCDQHVRGLRADQMGVRKRTSVRADRDRPRHADGGPLGNVGRVELPSAAARRERGRGPHHRPQLLRSAGGDRTEPDHRTGDRAAGIPAFCVEPMRVNTGGGAGWVGLVLITTSVCVSAHGGEVHSLNAPQAFSPWDFSVLIGLLIVGSLYLRGTILLARRGASGRRFEPIAFAIGWSALVLSILPPIDNLSIEYFSVHMIQHELMMLVGAPLLILGRPLQRCLTGMPDSLRMPTARILQTPSMSWTWRILTAPLVAWALHGLAIWVWHMPALYDAAVGNEAIHTLQHAMFVGTAALFWWGMLYGRYGRAGYGAAVFYVFLTAVHTGILGAMVTFSRTPLYSIYGAPAAAHGVDQLVDQQRAGLLMWIPAGIVMTLLGLALFAAWLGGSGRESISNAKFRMT